MRLVPRGAEQDADAQVEAVEHDVEQGQQSENAHPEEHHRVSSASAIARGRLALDGSTEWLAGVGPARSSR